MCRTGGPRCPDSPGKRARSNARKRLSYHAKKEGLTVEEYQQKHPDKAAEHGEVKDQTEDVPGAVRNPETVVQPLDVVRGHKFADEEEHIEASREELAHVSPEGQNVLAAYTSTRFHKKINNALWSGTHTYENTGEVYGDLDTSSAAAVNSRAAARGINKKENFHTFVNTLDDAISAVPPQDKTVYRGVKMDPTNVFSPEELSAMKFSDHDTPEAQARYRGYAETAYAPGKVIHFPAYTSTTDAPEIATDFSMGGGTDGIFFEMRTYRGVRASAIAQDNADEEETLLPRDTYWKVAGNQYGKVAYQGFGGHDDSTPGDRHVVTLVECDEHGNELTDNDAASRKPRPVEDLIDFKMEEN